VTEKEYSDQMRCFILKAVAMVIRMGGTYEFPLGVFAKANFGSTDREALIRSNQALWSLAGAHIPQNDGTGLPLFNCALPIPGFETEESVCKMAFSVHLMAYAETLNYSHAQLAGGAVLLEVLVAEAEEAWKGATR